MATKKLTVTIFSKKWNKKVLTEELVRTTLEKHLQKEDNLLDSMER